MTLFITNTIGKNSIQPKIGPVINWLLFLLFLTSCSSIDTPTQSSNIQHKHSKPYAPKTTDSDSNPPRGKSINVYIDPQTGAFISEPKQGQEALKITPEMQNATSTSSEGLVEKMSPVPGGGVMIDLEGRFQSPLLIIQDPSGNQKTRHLNDLPQYSPQQLNPIETEDLGHEKK